MKINPKILSLPPYISTSWNHVIALYVKEEVLVVSMVDGEIVEIPDLKPEIIDLIFNAHTAHMEYEVAREQLVRTNQNPMKNFNPTLFSPDSGSDSPFRFAFSTLDGLGYALQHNPSQANAPEIPKDVLQKISDIAKIVAPEESGQLPKAEPHCNCMYCQIARAIQGEAPPAQNLDGDAGEPVSEEDLKFQEWDIVKTGDKLYCVSNRLDEHEKYNVYLGDPVGCTCGKPGCEHIHAVLQS